MKQLTHWATALITLSIISFIGWSDPFVKETLRLKSFDLIQQYDVPTTSQDIAIVEIDERAIEEYGQWPWKRTVIADLIWKLRDAGAGVIILPVLFSEEDRLLPSQHRYCVLQALLLRYYYQYRHPLPLTRLSPLSKDLPLSQLNGIQNDLVQKHEVHRYGSGNPSQQKLVPRNPYPKGGDRS